MNVHAILETPLERTYTTYISQNEKFEKMTVLVLQLVLKNKEGGVRNEEKQAAAYSIILSWHSHTLLAYEQVHDYFSFSSTGAQIVFILQQQNTNCLFRTNHLL